MENIPSGNPEVGFFSSFEKYVLRFNSLPQTFVLAVAFFSRFRIFRNFRSKILLLGSTLND
jgi:hypothetical protein